MKHKWIKYTHLVLSWIFFKVAAYLFSKLIDLLSKEKKEREEIRNNKYTKFCGRQMKIKEYISWKSEFLV